MDEEGAKCVFFPGCLFVRERGRRRKKGEGCGWEGEGVTYAHEKKACRDCDPYHLVG